MTKKDDDFIIDARTHNVKVTNSEEFAIKVIRIIVKYRYYLAILFVGIMIGIIFE